MKGQPNKAEQYRREAAACLEVGSRMSVEADRARMLKMAQRWLELAEKEEAAKPSSLGQG